MARAAVQYRMTDSGEWQAVGVWLATPAMLQSRVLPGVGMDRWFADVHEGARPPYLDEKPNQRGTWEDWIGWALGGLSNGQTMEVGEVPPEVSVDVLYARWVLHLPDAEVAKYRPTGIPNVSVVPVESLLPGARA
jgi:hypothetical protein